MAARFTGDFQATATDALELHIVSYSNIRISRACKRIGDLKVSFFRVAGVFFKGLRDDFFPRGEGVRVGVRNTLEPR